MLVHYRDMLFLPGGNQAAFQPADISMDASNQVPLMFADAGATVPLTSPLMTDGMGTIDFYAAPGFYLAEIAGTKFRIDIAASFTAPVWPDLCVHMQTVPAAVWTVDHWFGTKPAVSIDTGTAHVETQVDHPSLTQTVLTFSSAVTGAAYLRR